jgi:hypothetical protein
MFPVGVITYQAWIDRMRARVIIGPDEPDRSGRKCHVAVWQFSPLSVLADLDDVATCVRVWRVFKDGEDSATGAVNFYR